MLGFDYYRQKKSGYAARTPGAAMRGVIAGILPMENYISIATGIRSLVEEPYDLDALERLLSREDLDVHTNVMLVRIFERLVKGHDAEVALIAAEGINLIENRYNIRIEQLRLGLEEEETSEGLRELGRLYHELAQLYEHAGSIRRFYLREAHGAVARLGHLAKMKPDDVVLLVDILLDLDIPDQAAAVVEAHAEAGEPATLVLQARIEFSRGNYLKVLEICSFLVQVEDRLSRADRDLIDFWLDR